MCGRISGVRVRIVASFVGHHVCCSVACMVGVVCGEEPRVSVILSNEKVLEQLRQLAAPKSPSLVSPVFR
jgi:hypothetical protein